MQKTITWKRIFVGPSRSHGKEGNRKSENSKIRPRKPDGRLIQVGPAALLIESDLSIHLAWLITSNYAVDGIWFWILIVFITLSSN